MSTHKPHTPESSAAGLAEAYLRDLDRALAAAEPREREETLAEVGEQLHEAAAADPTGDQVRRRIEELGPVDAIAAAATPADGPATPTPATPTQGPPRDWFVVGTTIASGVALITALLYFPLAAIIALVTFVLGIVQLFTSRAGRMLPVLSIVMSAVVLVMAAIAILGLVAWQTFDDSSVFIEEDTGQVEEAP